MGFWGEKGPVGGIWEGGGGERKKKKKEGLFPFCTFQKGTLSGFFFHVSGKCFLLHLLQIFLSAMLSAFLSPSYFLFFFSVFLSPPKKRKEGLRGKKRSVKPKESKTRVCNLLSVFI